MADTKNWLAHVDTFVDPDGSESQQAGSRAVIRKLLLNRSINIQEVVGVTGKYLTSTDNAIRARGILLLGELLVELAAVPMEDVAVKSLATFFTARLADWHCLRGALIGSIALLRRSSQVGAVASSDVEAMAKSVLENLHVQALGQKDRLLSLELFDCLLNLHSASVVALGDDLVYGVCAAIEEEKDPRCLLIGFRLVEYMAWLFPDPDGPLSGYVEDLFDIVGRYFPISFSPPPNDTRGISRDDLTAALLRVFISTPLFAPYCIPLLLEKLSSSLQTAKLDSLKSLGFCALAYGPVAMSSNADDIWSALKSELIPPSDEASESSLAQNQKGLQILEEGYLCLTHCIEAFQKGKEPECPVAGGLLKLLLEDECVEDLLRYVKSDLDGVLQAKNADSSGGSNSFSLNKSVQVQAIVRVLGAAVRASSSSCYLVTSKIFTCLLSATGISCLVSSVSQSSDKKLPGDDLLQRLPLSVIGLGTIVEILEGNSHVARTMAVSTLIANKLDAKIWLEPIHAATGMLVQVFSQVLAGRSSSEELQKLGVAGLQALASFPPHSSPLSNDQLQYVLSILAKSMVDDIKVSVLKEEVLGAILAVSKLEEEFSEVCGRRDVSTLNVVIPELLEAVAQTQSTGLVKSHLRALAAISAPRQLARLQVLDGLRPIILNSLSQAVVTAHQSNGFAKVVMILKCLSEDVIPICESSSSDQLAACDIVLDLWDAIADIPQAATHISKNVLSPLMAVICVTVQRCPEMLQMQILGKAVSVLSNKISSEELVILDFNSKDMNDKGWVVALIASTVVGLHSAVWFEERDMLLRLFLSASLADFDHLITSAAAQAAASLLNKWGSGVKNSEPDRQNGYTLHEAIALAVDEGWMPVVNEIQRETTGEVPEINSRVYVKKKAVRAVHGLAWAGKGFAMRGHTRVAGVAATMLTLLQLESLSDHPSNSDETHFGTSTSHNFSEDDHSSAIGKAAAESFSIIMKDYPTCLSRDHNAVIRPLYKQRFFTSMLLPLTEAVRVAGNQPYRVWLYRAFGHLLGGTPHGAILTEGKKVFPLILEGLLTLCNYPEDSDLLLSTLLALSSFLIDENHGRSIAAEYVSAMVNRLIPLTQYCSSMVVRETALQCLAAIVGLPFIRVFPLKLQVMKAITAALDDRKRRVRQTAVRCRQVWAAISSK